MDPISAFFHKPPKQFTYLVHRFSENLRPLHEPNVHAHEGSAVLATAFYSQ